MSSPTYNGERVQSFCIEDQKMHWIHERACCPHTCWWFLHVTLDAFIELLKRICILVPPLIHSWPQNSTERFKVGSIPRTYNPCEYLLALLFIFVLRKDAVTLYRRWDVIVIAVTKVDEAMKVKDDDICRIYLLLDESRKSLIITSFRATSSEYIAGTTLVTTNDVYSLLVNFGRYTDRENEFQNSVAGDRLSLYPWWTKRIHWSIGSRVMRARNSHFGQFQLA